MRKSSAGIRYIRRGKGLAKTKSKYKNCRVEYRGIKFDSQRERDRYIELELLVRAGEITDLKWQVPLILRCSGKEVKSAKGRVLKYLADFEYWDKEQGCLRWEDVKGYDTPLSALKRAMIETEYGIKIEIVR